MIPQRKKLYIAGPMTGIPQFNFPAFDVAAASLRSYGYLVVSPVELDEPSARAAALSNETGDPEQYNADTGETWGDLLARDVKMIADEVSGVVALEGWEESRGARLEVFVARTCGKPVYSYEEWLNDPTPGAPLTDEFLIPDWEIADVLHETVFGGDKFEPPKPKLVTHKFRPSPELGAAIEKLQAKVDEERPRLSPTERALIEAADKAFQNYLLNGTDNPVSPSPLQKIVGPEPGAPVKHTGKPVGHVTNASFTADDNGGFQIDAQITDVELIGRIKEVANNCLVKRDFTIREETRVAVDPAGDDKLADSAKGFDLQGEVRITSETGGQKGRKPQRMDLLPPEALLALSEVYGMGAEKYDDHNYLKGYDWSLSFGALLRHVMAAEKGEWLDDESGLPHVMHAAWHCFALFMFEKHGLGTDDRIKTVVEGLRS